MDTQLAEALQSGDYGAFEHVFENYWEKVFSYLSKKTHSTEAAKDLTQLVFIKLWNYRSGVSADIPLNEQIFRKTKQVFIDWLRQEMRRRQHIADTMELPDMQGNDAGHDRIEIRNDVANAIRLLPPKRKEIFELRHIYGYSYKEIAELLGISTKTVDSQLTKANLQLRKILQTAIFSVVLQDVISHVK
ncbi:sigma-70 family RNA polymerase sigma factor [Chitinophaga sp.]|uniref:RNA polymerase sigma factor n=1 Tax=Chitinophaga sp. TaxID=1869181 RepID=UPI00262946E9|nr:sigma-70 family RNA polymerase sigma factor [uncultured Chitinophaga sp.]